MLLHFEVSGDGIDEMQSALEDMYGFAVKAVTRKNGTSPRDWYFPISECNFTFSLNEANCLPEMIKNFRTKFEMLNNDLSNGIIVSLTNEQVELAMECLLSSLAER